MKKLNFSGFAHWIAPALIVAVVGGIGTYLVVGSHADAVKTGADICGSGYKRGAVPSVDSSPLYKDGDFRKAVGGKIHVYDNGKYLCATLEATGSARDVSKKMSVKITIGPDWKNGIDRTATDSGTFRYYAGPAKVIHTYAAYANSQGNALVTVTASMVYDGHTYTTLNGKQGESQIY